MTTIAPEGAIDLLTQGEAEARAARVRHADYDLAIDLRRGSDTYRGEVVIRFDLTGEGDLFLDFRGKTIERLEVNGRPVEGRWTGYRLTLPGEALALSNEVRITYENEYDHTGDGFHQFVDPEDGEEYLYTNFEPYEAHRLFPNFDQPDIKGAYRLAVTAPSGWEVVGNSRVIEEGPADDGRVRHVFEQTKPFSTYLFALVVGPYHVVRDEHGGVPLGIYCRRSLVKFLDPEEIFTVSKQGLDFFAAFFDYPYPFTKYDQIMVPEATMGAMENVGAVTHNERRVFRDPPTERQRQSRAEVILHEMAHMWFGNLVTMRWWNDLWLNESFATYISYLAVDEATRFTAAWKEFASSEKGWAYHQDQLPTTHPIAGQVADTDATFLNFDGITYGKGAAVIKQLVAAIGLDGFREGMRVYFKRHEYGNATLDQFLRALEDGSGRDLGEWARLWLETASLNTIAAEWESDGERLTDLRLTQSAPPDWPTLRPHTLAVGLVREEDGRLTVESVPAQIREAEAEVAAARGRPAPQLVFPNYDDHAYTKVALDAESLAFVRGRIDRVDDALLRQLLWMSLWDMVRDQKLSSLDYLALVREKGVAETDLAILEANLERAAGAISRYVPESRREAEAHRLFVVARDALRRAPAGDMQITWARTLIDAAIVPDDVRAVLRLAGGEQTIPGLTIDQEMRWTLALKCVGYGMPEAAERIAAERERDPSDRGQRALLRAETSRPDAEAKAAAWARFGGDGYGSLALTSAAMSGFRWRVQQALTEPYVERFFETVGDVFREHENEFAVAYFGQLFPHERVEPAILDRSERLLAELGDRDAMLTRVLREANDDLARAIACRAYAEG